MTNVSPSVKEALPNVNHFISPYKWKKNKKKRFFFVFTTNAKIYKIRKNHTELVWIYPLTGRGEQPISGTVRCMFPHENSISWKMWLFSNAVWLFQRFYYLQSLRCLVWFVLLDKFPRSLSRISPTNGCFPTPWSFLRCSFGWRTGFDGVGNREKIMSDRFRV